MRILLIGVGALLLGVGGGAYVSASRAAAPLVEELKAARADSLAALGEDGHGEEHPTEAPDDAEAEATADQGPAPDRSHDDDGTEGTHAQASSAEGQGGPAGPGRTTAETGPSAAQPGGAPSGAADGSGAGAETGGLPSAARSGPQGPTPGARPAGGSTDAGSAVTAPDPEASRKLARIFGAMRPGDAAAVLTEMTNAEVEAILLTLSERQAAAILGNFEPDRAAGLSRAVLGLARTGS